MKSLFTKLFISTLILSFLFPSISYAANLRVCSSITDPTEKAECKQLRSLYRNTGITAYCPQGSIDTSLVLNIDIKVAGTTAAEKVWTALLSAGFTPEQAAGIMGNLEAESHFSPAALGDGGTSSGLAQWHRGRQQALFTFISAADPNLLQYVTSPTYQAGNGDAFIAKAGDKIADALIAIQVKFLVNELGKRGPRHNYSTFDEVYEIRNNELETIKAMSNANVAAAFFRWSFERPGSSTVTESGGNKETNNSSRTSRQNAAQKYLALFSDNTASAGVIPSYTVPGGDNCIVTGDGFSLSNDYDNPDDESIPGGFSSGTSSCGTTTIDPSSLSIRTIGGRQYTYPWAGHHGSGHRSAHGPAKNEKFADHTGPKDAVDLAFRQCAPLVAITSGKISNVKTGTPSNNPNGKKGPRDSFTIVAGNDRFYYTHLMPGSATSVLRNGQSVKVGQFVGNVGDGPAGDRTPHLHISYSPDGNGTSDYHNATPDKQRMAPLLNQL